MTVIPAAYPASTRTPGPAGSVHVVIAPGPGTTVTPFYDSLMAKLIVYGPDRAAAIAKARAALAGFEIAGPKSNLPFFAELLDNEEFRSGDYDTGIVARMRPAKVKKG